MGDPEDKAAGQTATGNLAGWLGRHGLGQYAGILSQNDVDLEVLPQLSEDDLKELGFSLGHRRKLRAALEAAPPTATTPTDPDLPEGAERRQLTVLFCDLAGSTELSARLDPEDLREVLGRYHDLVTRLVASHGGHVAKLLGDGVLAYFGWPHAHEDDAARAVRTALAAVHAVGEIEAAGAALAARAGIATGPVVVGDQRSETAHERGAVAGATPNMAARLQGLAQPGEVVIHGATRRLIGGAFDLDPAGEHSLKGFAEPVAAWRVRGAAQAGSRFEALHGGNLTGFIGRTQEIGLLEDRWRQALGGEGQVVLLSGEAGIGKSRILREFSLQRAGAPCRTLGYQCAPHEVNAAFHPIIAEISATAGLQPGDPPERRLDKLETHLDGVFGAAGDTAPLFAALLGLPTDRYPAAEMTPQRRKQRTIALLTERVARLADAQPVLILAEDLHWADPSSLEALEALIEGMQDLSVLVVATCRPEFRPNWGVYGHVTQHSLNRLGRGDGLAIATAVTGGKALPDEVVARIVAQTDGIPLFVEELTKTVIEAGILEERDGRYVLKGPLPALVIPETLQDSLMARLDRLAPVKRVIQAAACIGREFDAALLGAALEMDESALEAALDQLLAAELIFRRGGAAGSRYIFKHALVQDAAYASLLTSARRTLHQHLAQALERSEDPDTLELARHFFEAGVHERAAHLYLEAGQRLLQASAVPEAIGALERGLEAMSALPDALARDRLELDMRVTLGAARMAILGWQHPSVLEVVEPAVALAKALGDTEALGPLIWGVGSHFATRAEVDRALAWLLEQWPTARDSGDSGLQVLYHMSVSDQYFWLADYERSLYHTDEVRRIYRRDLHARLATLTNHDALCHAQNFAGSLCEWIRGYPERAVTRLEEAVGNARAIGQAFNLMFTLTCGSTALLYLHDTDRLLAQCDEAERVATDQALGVFAEKVCVGQWRGAASILRGDFGAGYAISAEGNAFWTEAEGRLCTAMMRSWIVLGLAGLGRVGDALSLNAENIAHCRDTGDRYMEPECVRLQGELVLAADDPDPPAAERLFREAIVVAQAHGAKSWELRAAMSLARLLDGQDRQAEARASLEPLLGWFTEGLQTHDLRQAQSLVEAL